MWVEYCCRCTPCEPAKATSAKKPPGNWRWMSKLYCSTYPYLGLAWGASVGEPFAAIKAERLGCGLRPGGNMIPPAPNGPLVSSQEKPANVVPVSLQLVPFKVP